MNEVLCLSWVNKLVESIEYQTTIENKDVLREIETTYDLLVLKKERCFNETSG